VFNMVSGVALALGQKPVEPPKLAWDAPRLLWAVREPFVSRTSQAGLVYGILATGLTMGIESMMPENGVIFSDGIEADALEFNAGTIATIRVSERKARLVVPS
jgi:hypothetical protein